MDSTEPKAKTLKEYLVDWTDIDGAEHCLAISIGLMSPNVCFVTDVKHVFWSNNPVGNALAHVLEELTSIGVLEKRDEPDFQCRWNPAFVGSWQTRFPPVGHKE